MLLDIILGLIFVFFVLPVALNILGAIIGLFIVAGEVGDSFNRNSTKKKK